MLRTIRLQTRPFYDLSFLSFFRMPLFVLATSFIPIVYERGLSARLFREAWQHEQIIFGRFEFMINQRQKVAAKRSDRDLKEKTVGELPETR